MQEPSIQMRYYNAFFASKEAKNPAFKSLWLNIARELASKIRNNT